MDKIKKLLLLSCRKVTELMEKKLHVKLSLVEKAQLAVHSTVCPGCREYENQSSLIDRALGSSNRSGEKDVDPKNAEELRSRIIERLKKE